MWLSLPQKPPFTSVIKVGCDLSSQVVSCNASYTDHVKEKLFPNVIRTSICTHTHANPPTHIHILTCLCGFVWMLTLYQHLPAPSVWTLSLSVSSNQIIPSLPLSSPLFLCLSLSLSLSPFVS